LVRQLEFEGVSRRGKRRRTTTPDPAAPPAPDLVKRRFPAERPDQLWLADITYLPTYEGWLFLTTQLAGVPGLPTPSVPSSPRGP
jgi:transposase InsO family protein